MTGIEASIGPLEAQLTLGAGQPTQTEPTTGKHLHRDHHEAMKFIPRRVDWVTTIPAGGAGNATATWFVNQVKPSSGKIWNLRASAVWSNDPTNGSLVGSGATQSVVFAIGNPNQLDAAVEATAAVNLESTLYTDAVGGAIQPGNNYASLLIASYNRYCFWAGEHQNLYGIFQIRASTLAAGTNLIFTSYIDEYELSDIIPSHSGGMGGIRPNRTVHALPEA